jgi:ABC-2 type transport system ATP-binding protein
MLGGIDLLRQPAEARARMGVVFQSPAVDKHLSVMENLRLHASLYGIGGRQMSGRLDEALDWSDLKDRLQDRVDQLSGGLARQVELAKALLTQPAFLLLDEPTTGLDPASRRNFVGTLHALQRRRNMTVLMTSHVFSEAEDADQVAIMKDGRLLANDSPASLRAGLGREMVVVQSRNAEILELRIQRELSLKTRRHGEEIRLEETHNGASLPILEQLLTRYRPDIDSIAIKQPTLEDVFIHLTGKAALPQPQLELVAK